MPDRPDSLVVWYEGVPIAELRERSGSVELEYRTEALDRYDIGTPLVSCSLPLEQDRKFNATNFLDGVLPEGAHRNDLAELADVRSADTFGLLARFGRDIAGALTIADPAWDPESAESSVMPLSDEELANEVAGLPDRALGVHDDSELSLAGLQDKMVLSRLEDGSWGRPIHGHPSTHILKLDHRTHRGLVAAEADALTAARAVGLTSVTTELVNFDGVEALIVSRFDRQIDGGTVKRLHQEDACQALGVSPHLKYEVGRPGKRPGGGPSLTQIAELLDRYAVDPLRQLDLLVGAVTFTVLIGNADAHGKNMAFLHPSPGQIELAPLYDTVPTILWPRLNRVAAMSINGITTLDSVSVNDVAAEAARWKHDPRRAAQTAIRTAEALADVADSGVIDPTSALTERLRSQSERFSS